MLGENGVSLGLYTLALDYSILADVGPPLGPPRRGSLSLDIQGQLDKLRAERCPDYTRMSWWLAARGYDTLREFSPVDLSASKSETAVQ
jgi:hypothetical protein